MAERDILVHRTSYVIVNKGEPPLCGLLVQVSALKFWFYTVHREILSEAQKVLLHCLIFTMSW